MYLPLRILNVDDLEIFEEGSPFKPFQFPLPPIPKFQNDNFVSFNALSISKLALSLQRQHVTIQDIPSVCGLHLADHFTMGGCWSLALAVENGKKINCDNCEYKTKTRKPRKKPLFPKKMQAKAEKAMTELRLALGVCSDAE